MSGLHPPLDIACARFYNSVEVKDMENCEYHRIKKLDEELRAAQVESSTIDEIMSGGGSIKRGTTPAKKADWMRCAMSRMDKLLDSDIRHAVREACACCLGGKRGKMSKGIAKDHQTFKQRIEAANEAKFVFGNSVSLQDDGRILVSFFPEGTGSYRCVCLPKAAEPISITYCYCCGGHVKHHMQNALDTELDVEVRSSALSSGGKRGCTFLLSISTNQ